MTSGGFKKNVFINCPFDEKYEPILQAILFCITYLGFTPRIARERSNSGEMRIEKIKELIESSKFSIHDLSRCQAEQEEEYYRLNMPFELGYDFGCKEYFGRTRNTKKFLILEEKPFRYQAALSDIAGFDIEQHEGSYEKAVRKVRNWLVFEANAERIAPQKILYAYADFQEWHYETLESEGYSEEDILDTSTPELLLSMQKWVKKGKPI